MDMVAKAVAQEEEEAAAAAGGGRDESDIGSDELLWEQLEVARNIFAGLGSAYDSRRSAVHELLADYLSETDAEGGRVAAEYGLAADAEERAHGPASRSVANCRYMQFLALRRDAPQDALAAMARAIVSFRAIAEADGAGEDDRETVGLLEQELAAYRAALDAYTRKATGAGVSTVVGFARDAPPTPTVAAATAQPAGDGEEVVPVRAEVAPVAVTVKPRRRAKPVAVVPSAEEIENGVRKADGEATGESVAKKRKI
jgi:hypothetical protein